MYLIYIVFWNFFVLINILFIKRYVYIYTYYSIKILDKKVPTLKEIPRSAPG
jgi:hypothetical protein